MTRTVQGAFCALLFMALPFFASAQENMNQRQMISELQVDPAMQSQFEENLKKMFSIAKDQGYSHPLHVAQWHSTYWLVAPMENYASLDTIFADREMVWNKGGEAFQTHYKAMTKAVMNEHSWLTQYKADLSYNPEGSRTDDMTFMDIETIRIKPGHWDEMEAMLKEAKTIYGTLEIPYAYDVYFEGLGADGNQVTFISYAKNPLERARAAAEVDARLKDDEGWGELMDRYMNIAHSSNNIQAWMRKDLSLVPQGSE